MTSTHRRPWIVDNELTPKQFSAISSLVKDWSGINLHVGKMALVKARLRKRLGALGMTSFGQYVDHVASESQREERAAMLAALATNLTSFFREPQHFDHLRDVLLPNAIQRNAARRQIRIWSAGCSSGEEPYSIAMVLQEAAEQLAGWDTSILATDLSQAMIERAQAAVYGERQFSEMDPRRIAQFFVTASQDAPANYRIKGSVRRMVHFCRLNLVESWPMSGPFDAIFCRNVMIYFDKPTQQGLIERFRALMAPGGMLYLGHAESLAGVRHDFRYCAPAVYQKKT